MFMFISTAQARAKTRHLIQNQSVYRDLAKRSYGDLVWWKNIPFLELARFLCKNHFKEPATVLYEIPQGPCAEIHKFSVPFPARGPPNSVEENARTPNRISQDCQRRTLQDFIQEPPARAPQKRFHTSAPIQYIAHSRSSCKDLLQYLTHFSTRSHKDDHKRTSASKRALRNPPEGHGRMGGLCSEPASPGDMALAQDELLPSRRKSQACCPNAEDRTVNFIMKWVGTGLFQAPTRQQLLFFLHPAKC